MAGGSKNFSIAGKCLYLPSPKLSWKLVHGPFKGACMCIYIYLFIYLFIYYTCMCVCTDTSICIQVCSCLFFVGVPRDFHVNLEECTPLPEVQLIRHGLRCGLPCATAYFISKRAESLGQQNFIPPSLRRGTLWLMHRLKTLPSSITTLPGDSNVVRFWL